MSSTESFIDRVDELRGTAASIARDAKAGVEEAAAAGREAVQGAKVSRCHGCGFRRRVDSARRPYTTLAAVGFLGFLYGAFRRR